MNTNVDSRARQQDERRIATPASIKDGQPYTLTVKYAGTQTLTGSPPLTITCSAPVATTTQLYFIETDHLNTPRQVSNLAQQAVWRLDIGEPFGDATPNANPSALGAFEFNLRFPGQYRDKETNLNYNYFRDYDPQIGRYVESDPFGLAGGLNTYTYVGGNPLSMTDPRGLDSQRMGPYDRPPRCPDDSSRECSVEWDKYYEQLPRYPNANNQPPEPREPLIPLPEFASGQPGSAWGDPLRRIQGILDKLNPPKPAKGSTSSGRRASLPLRKGVDECAYP